MKPPDPLSVAEAERDHIATLIAGHLEDCPGDCPDCHSLGDHYLRAQKQVDMLAPAAEQDAMFGP